MIEYLCVETFHCDPHEEPTIQQYLRKSRHNCVLITIRSVSGHLDEGWQMLGPPVWFESENKWHWWMNRVFSYEQSVEQYKTYTEEVAKKTKEKQGKIL